jgi:hypothetical protein
MKGISIHEEEPMARDILAVIVTIVCAVMLIGCGLSESARLEILRPALKDDLQWMRDIKAYAAKGIAMNECRAGLAKGLHVVSQPDAELRLAMNALSEGIDATSPDYKACYSMAVWWVYKAHEAKSVGKKFVIPTVTDAIDFLGGM